MEGKRLDFADGENNDKLYLSSKRYKSNKETSGNKVHACNAIMQHLERTMIKNGSNIVDIMNFEKDFLEANGIVVPNSFFEVNKARNDSLIDFINSCLKVSKQNIKGNTFYDAYIYYCHQNIVQPMKKTEVFAYLRAVGLMVSTAAVEGVTYHNVILNRCINTKGANNGD